MTTRNVKSTSDRTIQKFWTIRELAEAIGVCELTIRRWCDQEKFPQPKRFGRRLIRWDDRDIQEFLSNQ